MIRSIAPSGLLPAAQEPHVRRYGRLTIEAHYRHRALTGEILHAFLDGEDVTRWTVEADDRAGWVVLVALNGAPIEAWLAKGGYYAGDAHVRIDGREVLIRPGAPL